MTTIATEESYEDPNFERKLDIITAGTCPHIKQHLLTKILRENCKTIVNYVLDFQTEVSPSTTYRIYINTRLKHFSEFHKSTSFKNITRQDIIDYLDSYRKPETIDPLRQWIGTYNTIRICLQRFFR